MINSRLDRTNNRQVVWKSFRLRLNFQANQIRTCLIENRSSRRMINSQIYLSRKRNVSWKKRYSTLSNYFHTQNDLIVHCLVLFSSELAIFKYTRQIYLTDSIFLKTKPRMKKLYTILFFLFFYKQSRRVRFHMLFSGILYLKQEIMHIINDLFLFFSNFLMIKENDSARSDLKHATGSRFEMIVLRKKCTTIL